VTDPDARHDEAVDVAAQAPDAVPPPNAEQPSDERPPMPSGSQKINGPLHFGMGATIGIGAGLGIALGTLLGSLAAGLAIGAGLGVAAGAVLESRGRR
jgi:flagellar biosynthesis/type III secretory pathway ATPase